MVQFKEIKRKDNKDLSDEDIKEAYDFISAILKKRKHLEKNKITL